jgi:pantoate--beta-alanine ligase
VASIVVNRLQFAPREGDDTYRRTFEFDCGLLRRAGCNFVFAPSEAALYPQPQTYAVRPSQAGILEKFFRPGFFRGVWTMVHKLFNRVQPDIAVFGKKDCQQRMVLWQMVQQVALPIEIIGAETRRAVDGLALSARNSCLHSEERVDAVALSPELRGINAAVQGGCCDWHVLEVVAAGVLQTRGWQTDDVAIRRQADLGASAQCQPLVVVAAARIGTTRLIDRLEIPAGR